MVQLKEKLEKFYLSDKDYFMLVSKCDKSMLLSMEESELLFNGAVPRFIAGIPYLSGESNPDILAVMNLNSYIAGIRNNEFFSQRDNETIKDRIEPYIHSVNGLPETVALCKLVLEEVSLMDHYNDKEEDKKTGHSNPINKGIIDFETEKRRIDERKARYPEYIQTLVNGSFEGKILWPYWNG